MERGREEQHKYQGVAGVDPEDKAGGHDVHRGDGMETEQRGKCLCMLWSQNY